MSSADKAAKPTSDEKSVSKPEKEATPTKPEEPTEAGSEFFKGVVGAFIVVIIAVLIYAAMAFQAPTPPAFTTKSQGGNTGKSPSSNPVPAPPPIPPPGNKLFTREELKAKEGKYLSILGKVFDVSRKPEHYGPDGGYFFFTGKDGTRAFATGEFNEKGLREDVDGLSPGQIISIFEWVGTYETDYQQVGLLIGHWYTEKGEPTDALQAAKLAHMEARKQTAKEDREKLQTPPCNMEWKQTQRKFWCSDSSGGVKRSWNGVLRKIWKVSEGTEQCVCVQPELAKKDRTGKFKQFGDGCPAMATSCTFGADGKLIASSLAE